MKSFTLGKTACAIALFFIAAALASSAQTFTTLAAFDGTDGLEPASLVQGADANVYGTTTLGGYNFLNRAGYAGDGTIFTVAPDGGFKTVYEFCEQNAGCDDGESPSGGVILASDGNFYGATIAGGTSTIGFSAGVLYKVARNGDYTLLYSFCQQISNNDCLDGASPSGLVQGGNGNFYGTTAMGGVANKGTLFEVTATGQLTTLYSFCSLTNCADGSEPAASLALGADGSFYGTTSAGGTHTNDPLCNNGCGTIFRITPQGKLTTLYNFCSVVNRVGSCADGAVPSVSLVQGPDGSFYGTTQIGGYVASMDGTGTVFRITPAGKLTTIYSFCSQPNCADGAYPAAALVLGSDGNLYGTASGGGANEGGTVFQFSAAGELTTLYSFCSQANCADGSIPFATLLQATTGIFYGSTSAGGNLHACSKISSGCGTVFSLATGLGPFVEANPNFAAPGRPVGILGNNLTGSTSVTFNGLSATFTVLSNTSIEATVPAGVTSGTIQVTTPSGTLNSNVAFQVVP